MEKLKKYFIALGYTLGIILIFTIILSLLNYFDLLNNTVVNIIKLIIPIVATITGGFFVGKNSDRKGYQIGLKFGGIFALFCFIFTIIFSKITFNCFIYYLVILAAAMLGSILGINKKIIGES